MHLMHGTISKSLRPRNPFAFNAWLNYGGDFRICRCNGNGSVAAFTTRMITCTAYHQERVGVDGGLRSVTRPTTSMLPSQWWRSPQEQKPREKNGNYTIGTPLKGSSAPYSDPLTEKDLETLVEFISSVDGGGLVAISGAGCSTESDIPDYRSPNGAYSRNFKPMTHQEFLQSEKNRSRYWARSFAGWSRFRDVRHNDAHAGLARLQHMGWISEIITQNVDRLHQKAGSLKVTELHGTTHEVICLQCSNKIDRDEVQGWLEELNPIAAEAARQLAAATQINENEEKTRLLRAGTNVPIDPSLREQNSEEHLSKYKSMLAPDGELASEPRQNPDGDVELKNPDLRDEFQVPPCPKCGTGILKPDVVFFGDSLPAVRTKYSIETAKNAPGLLVVGSSLAVWSAFRLVKAAKENNRPVAVINVGPTRADDIVDLKIEALAGEVLSRLSTHPSMLLPPT